MCQSKIPVSPSGIEPATFRLVAQWKACYRISNSRCLEQKPSCPSSVFPAIFHVGIKIKIEVVRDVTPGRCVGANMLHPCSEFGFNVP
jgi:hypothetical protein